jgi:glutamate formiminotransferase
MFFTTLLVIGLRILLVRENKKLDQKYGTIEEQRARIVEAREGGESTVQDQAVENYGPMFRYVL